MKRFYCVVCKRMKRTQEWPRIISDVNSTIPRAREGECNRHRGVKRVSTKRAS